MPDDNTKTPTTPAAPAPTTDTNTSTEEPVAEPVAEPAAELVEEQSEELLPEDSGIISEVVEKINDAHNILVALSSDPSVDEMAAAIGVTLFLDKLGKHTTAIYSGATPNALEFLKPEETFEPTVDALQDFVIALNKDKADHLRYKLDGDFVKIYITPYRTRIAEDDLDFSYGDFNIDLVLALDVANGVDLDDALREHGRIMHDATIVNITNGNPGKLGEIEWSDKTASSVSEMLARLIYSMNSKAKIEGEEATAFLTGIVAATNRFSNNKTTSETMRISSKLMESGADQQLVSKNITTSVENEMYSVSTDTSLEEETPEKTNLDISHGEEQEVSAKGEPDLLDDLKTAEETLSDVNTETTQEETTGPINNEDEKTPEPESKPEPEPTPEPDPTPEPEPAPEPEPISAPESTPEPTPEPVEEPLNAGSNKYGQMLENALSSVDSPAPAPITTQPATNPAAMNAPAVPSNPEINGVPSINYMPLPDEQVLAPPPAPPIDMSSPLPESPATPAPTPVVTPAAVEPIIPAIPKVENPTPLGAQPAMQDQVYAPQVADPGAFKIPGM